MFSEYASRFLAQSQSRLGFDTPTGDDTTSPERTTTQQQRRYQRPSAGSRMGNPSRSYLQRPTIGSNPYGSTHSFSRFPFASRQQAREAPLFYSATDEFREEDDVEEREREVADYYALQRSRRHFTAEKLSESEEADEEADAEGDAQEAGATVLSHHYTGGRGRGIRSSWRGERRRERGRQSTIQESVMESPEQERAESEVSKSKGKLVDVELESSRRSSMESIHQDEIDSARREEANDDPAPFQTFRKTGITREHRWIPEETDEETARLNPRPPSPDRESVPDIIANEYIEPPRHDAVWSHLFLLALATMFATTLLVWLHTDEPARTKPIGDSIYTVLHKSFHLLATYTIVAVVVSALWLILLRSALRPLSILILIAVPIILFSFSMYPLVSSYKGAWHGTGFQDKVMRLLALFPLVAAGMWCYLMYKAMYSIDAAIRILDFACKILTASPALVAAGFATQAATIAWYWIWLGQFTRVFLEGRFTSKGLWVLDSGTWALAIYFVLMLLWGLSVISNIQRAVSAATTSQWYFHRNASPTPPSSRQVVLASLHHALTTLFGTICLSGFVTVAIRLPLLILPRRIIAPFTLFIYQMIPSPIAALTNPLTLTYAAIHSQPLATAARQLSSLPFVSRLEATTTLSPTTANLGQARGQGDALVQYRTAKLLLHATRYVMTLAMGFGGWVSSARQAHVDPGYTGSLYAYVVGFASAAIGWSVLGAVEGTVVDVVDAVVVCWGSEVASGTGGRFCREAGELFGGERDARGEV